MADRDRFGGSDRDYAYTDYSGRQGLDVRNPGDYAIQRAHSYPSNRQPLLNQPPMEGPPQRPHVNPRMRHINPRGMNQNYGGGIGGLQEEASLPWRWYQKLINKFGQEKGTQLWEQYASDDTGLGSTNEYQMAELSNKQGNFMESGLGNPNWYSNFPDYFDTVTGKGDWKQKLGWKDKATEQEVIDKLNQIMQERNQSLPWPVV